MFSGNRLCKLAVRGFLIGLLLAPVTLNAQEKPKEHPPPIEQSKGAAKHPPAPKNETAKAPAEQKPQPAEALPAPPVQDERPTEPACDPRRQEAEQREKADLKAQRDMAEAAFSLVDISWWQFWAGVVGITLLLATLWYTRKATNIASDTAEHQLRAYVSGQPDYIFSFDEQTPAQVRYTLRNHGQTPAKELVHDSIIEICPFPLPKGYPFPELPGKEGSKIVLYPDIPIDGHVTASRLFTAEDIERIVEGDKYRLFIFGLIKYRDIFSEPRESKFCWSIVGSQDFALVAAKSPGKFDISFNAADQHNEAT